MNRVPIAAAALLLAACQSMPDADAKAGVEAATAAWGLALASCNIDRIMSLYDPQAVVWPTTWRTTASSPQTIRKYFEGACSPGSGSKIAVTEQNARVYGDTAINSGTFSMSAVRDARSTPIPVRFSFVYRRSAGQWLIVDQHSSLMPVPR